MPITLEQVRSETWVKVYSYVGVSLSFEIYSSSIHRFSITHERIGKGKTKIVYTAYGRKTDSPSQAARYWNEAEKAANLMFPYCGPRDENGKASNKADGKPKGRKHNKPAGGKNKGAKALFHR